MSQELEAVDKIAEEAVEIFEEISSQEKSPKQVSKERHISLRTVYNRLNLAREIISKQIREIGEKHLADVWRKYNLLWDESWRMWQATSNPAFLKEMRSVLEAQRRMLSLDAPTKAAVNEDGKAVPGALVMIFSDSEYASKEKEIREKEAVEGQFEIIDDSTEVPLSDAEDEV